jgi:hypothetical protein
MSHSETKSPALIAYHIRKGADKSFWDRVGVAFVHKDELGYDLVLDSVPVDGRVTLRMPTEKSSAATDAESAIAE